MLLVAEVRCKIQGLTSFSIHKNEPFLRWFGSKRFFRFAFQFLFSFLCKLGDKKFSCSSNSCSTEPKHKEAKHNSIQNQDGILKDYWFFNKRPNWNTKAMSAAGQLMSGRLTNLETIIAIKVSKTLIMPIFSK